MKKTATMIIVCAMLWSICTPVSAAPHWVSLFDENLAEAFEQFTHRRNELYKGEFQMYLGDEFYSRIPIEADFSGYGITELTGIFELGNLRRLDLSDNNISNLYGLTLWNEYDKETRRYSPITYDGGYCMTQLRFLDLRNNPLDTNDPATMKIIQRYIDNGCEVLYDVKYFIGDTDGDGKIGINDVLEILKYLANIDCVIKEGNDAWNASLITGDEKPTINDALEILKKLAGIASVFDTRDQKNY